MHSYTVFSLQLNLYLPLYCAPHWQKSHCGVLNLVNSDLGVDTKWLPSVPYGEVWAFCIIAAIIQYTFVYEPDLMRRPFYQWIDDLSKDPQGRLDKYLLNFRRQYHVRVPKGHEVVERSACNTSFYYQGELLPEDPSNSIPDGHKPYMATGDCTYFDILERQAIV